MTEATEAEVRANLRKRAMEAAHAWADLADAADTANLQDIEGFETVIDLAAGGGFRAMSLACLFFETQAPRSA